MSTLKAVFGVALLSCSSPSTDPPGPPPPPAPPPAVTPLQWPVGRALFDGLFVMNYVDHGAGDGPRDYRCGTRTFDGHNGVDLSLTGFRAMDAGTPVVAAAAGRVLVAQYDQFDRNYETPYVGTLNELNQIQILHDDGTAAWYAHLRKNSIAVAVGERVSQGQYLAMIGSSGWSPLPHLHFELWAGRQFGSAVLDPFGQPCDQPPAYWLAPTPYTGDDGIDLYDADVTRNLDLLGTFGNVQGVLALKERLDRPAVVAATEVRLGVWLFHQSPKGGQYTVTVERPDGTPFFSQSRSSTTGRPFTWEVIAIPFGSASPPPGQWTLRVTAGSREIVRTFAVGAATEYGPRFYPLSGKSFRVGGAEIVDQLQLRNGGAGVTLRLDGAPATVSLDGMTVRIGPTSLPGRTAAFRVIAEDAAGRSDTMHYQLVDPSRFGGAAAGRP
ncbi:MAG: M23 family metallopeptidase [Gemmatimonadales bacterium]